jgi:hypothetical protein
MHSIQENDFPGPGCNKSRVYISEVRQYYRLVQYFFFVHQVLVPR